MKRKTEEIYKERDWERWVRKEDSHHHREFFVCTSCCIVWVVSTLGFVLSFVCSVVACLSVYIPAYLFKIKFSKSYLRAPVGLALPDACSRHQFQSDGWVCPLILDTSLEQPPAGWYAERRLVFLPCFLGAKKRFV